MINLQEFRENAHQMVDWMADFLENIETFPVKSQLRPGDIYHQLPKSPPQLGEKIETIFQDFQHIILPGMTHWQSPNFFAYFPGNSSYPSILAEMLTATLGAQCMIWETSPAAAELEELMMQWLREILDLPSHMVGTIQDTASSATLCAILSAREYVSDFKINQKGFQSNETLRVYCSSHTHSSIDKGVKIAGLGQNNLVKIAVDETFAMKPDALEAAIKSDIEAGLKPCCVIASLGTTSSTAIDPLEAIGKICAKYKVWLHVDAAYAGTAMILPELRWIGKGMEYADSFVFNPHKWMFTNFDCSAYFVKDKDTLLHTFSIMPEYLKTQVDDHVNNYRDWGIALGRRFRALKLWFVMRNYGVEGIKQRLRDHLNYAKAQLTRFEIHPDIEIMAPVPLNLICFRFHPLHIQDEHQLDQLNEQLLQRLNATGKMYLTHTRLNGKYVIRWVMGHTYLQERHIVEAWELMKEEIEKLVER